MCCREEQSNGWHRAEVIRLEQDIFTALAGQGKLYVYKTDRFWSQIKSAGLVVDICCLITIMHWLCCCIFYTHDCVCVYMIVVTVMLPSFFRSAIYASRLYLNQYHTTHPERLATNREGGPKTRGRCLEEVYILFVLKSSFCTPSNAYFILGNVYIHPTANIDPTAVVSVSWYWYLEFLNNHLQCDTSAWKSMFSRRFAEC